VIKINDREICLDETEGLLAWTDFDHIVWLAMDFIRRCPVEARTGLPWYLTYSCFWTDPLRPTDWPDNPAGKFAMAVETLIRYYAYSGETWFHESVRAMLDQLITYHTPEHFAWPGVPYASAEPGFGVYFGARADGHFVTEPDKIAQAALGYLNFFKLTGEARYLQHAKHCARVLARMCQAGDELKSPWPFRVDVRDNSPIETYSSHVIPAVRLFDALLKMGLKGSDAIVDARELVWKWLMEFPMKNGIWKGYFEDIRLDPENKNRDQYSPMETARYLLDHPERDPDWQEHVRDLLFWVQEHLGSEAFFRSIPIHEQSYCFHVMGSHTARFASICALFAEKANVPEYADLARRCFNWASYMTTDEGYVHVGIDRPDYYNQCWFTDGYFDYVPHFIDGMAAIPDLAPDSTDHLFRSSSIVTSISYKPLHVRYETFDANAQEMLKLTFRPARVISGELSLQEVGENDGVGWHWEEASRLLRVHHDDNVVDVMG
jgi:hypothetical protein